MVSSSGLGRAILIVCVMLTLPVGAQSVRTVKEGNRLYKEALYETAVNLYNKALKEGGQDSVARYNLGNALYRRGKAQENQDIDQAITDMEESLSSYAEVLKRNKKDQDAQFNFAFVQKELERLKKMKEEQEKKQEQPGKEEEKDQKAQNKKQQDGQPKDQQAKETSQSKKPSEQSAGEAKDQVAQDQDIQQGEQKGELSYKEAKSILEDYQRNEEPKGLLNFIQKSKTEKPVLKDW